MKEHFNSKGVNDFKNSKKFWTFYSASIKLKSDKSSNSIPDVFFHNDIELNTPEQIGDTFNTFFTSLKSNSLSSEKECDKFVDDTFQDLKRKNIIKDNTFKFSLTTESTVEKLLNKLDGSTGAGLTGIPTKVFKNV